MAGSTSLGTRIDGRKADGPKPQLPLISSKINCHYSCYVTQVCSLLLLPDLLQHAPSLSESPTQRPLGMSAAVSSLLSDRLHRASCCCTPRRCTGFCISSQADEGAGSSGMTFHPLGIAYLILPEIATWSNASREKTRPDQLGGLIVRPYRINRCAFVLALCARLSFERVHEHKGARWRSFLLLIQVIQRD